MNRENRLYIYGVPEYMLERNYLVVQLTNQKGRILFEMSFYVNEVKMDRDNSFSSEIKKENLQL